VLTPGKIANLRLAWYLDKINYLVPEQSGFRKGKGINDSLTQINIEVQNSSSNNQFMGMVSIDILRHTNQHGNPSPLRI